MTHEQKENDIEISTLNGKTYTIPSGVSTNTNLENIKEYLQKISGIPVSSQLLLTISGSEVNSDKLTVEKRLFVIDRREKDDTNYVTNSNGQVVMKIPTSGQQENLSRASNSLIFNSVKDFKHRLKFHVSDMKAMLECSYKKVELYSQHITEKQRQCEGCQATFQYINKESMKILKNKEWKERVEKLLLESIDKIEKMDTTLKKLASIPLDKAICKPNLQNLLDVITPEAAKEIYHQFSISKDSLNIEFLKINSQTEDLENRRMSLEVEPSVDFEKQWIEISNIKKELLAVSQECDRLLNVIQSGDDQDLEEGTSLLPSPAEQEQQIKIIQELDNKLTKIMDSTTIMTEILLKKLKMMVSVWEDILQLQDILKINICNSCQKHEELMRKVLSIHHLHRIYRICIEEMKRRLSWGNNFHKELDKLQDKLKTITEYEIEKRLLFFRKYASYIWKTMFPGLTTPLPIAGVYIEEFDTELPMLDFETDTIYSLNPAHTSESRKLDEEITTLKKDKEKLATQFSMILHTPVDIPASILLHKEDGEEFKTKNIEYRLQNVNEKFSDSQFVFVEDEKQSLEKQISSLKQDLKHAKCEIADIQMKLQVAQKTVSVTAQKYRDIQSQKLVLEKEKNEIHSFLSVTNEENQILRIQLEGQRKQAHNGLVEVMKQMGVLQINLEKAISDKEDIEKENLSIKATLEQLEKEMNSLKTENEKLNKEMDQLKVNSNQTKNQQEELYQQLNKNNDAVKDFESEKMKLEISKAKLEMEKLNLDTAKTKAEFEKLDLESSVTKIVFEKKTLEEENVMLKEKQKRLADFFRGKFLQDQQKLEATNQRNKILEEEITQLKLSNAKLMQSQPDLSVTTQGIPNVSLGDFVYGQMVIAQEKQGSYELVKVNKGSPHYFVHTSSLEGINGRKIIFGKILYLEEKQTVKLGSPNLYNLPIGSEYYSVYITVSHAVDN